MQQSLFTGEALKEIALDGLEIKHGDFLGTARSVATCLIRKDGQASADGVRKIMDDLGMEAPSPAVWGALFKSKEFQFVGWVKSTRASNHARPIRSWKLDEPEKLNYQPPRKPHWQEKSRYNSFHREG